MARIAVAGFQHETNTFAPQRASWSDFEQADFWPPYLAGPGLLAGVASQNIPITGAVGALTGAGHEVVPLCWCAAPPSSYVKAAAYELIVGRLIDSLLSAGPIDAIYLDLHGAMVAEHHEDGEGELLRRLRALIGDTKPIVASLDFHANLTPDMVRLASAVVGYRTYPHVDMAATGTRAAFILDALIDRPEPLYKAYRQIDFLIPLAWQCTLTEPAKGIFELLAEIEKEGDLISITHTPGFPPADIAECGPAVVAYARSKDAAQAAAQRLAEAIHAKESSFDGKVWDADGAAIEAIRLARRMDRPVILADVQDNPGAGGTSDTVGLLRALMHHKADGAVVGLMIDPEAAAAAHQAGEGSVLQRGIGASVGYAGERPVEAAWRVRRLGSGKFKGSGPFSGGSTYEIGPMALLTDESSGVSVVLAGKRAQAADQAMFRHVGVDPTRTPIIALKSTVHFRADFDPIAGATLVVNAPGANITDPAEFDYRRLRPGVRLGPNGPTAGRNQPS